MRATALPSLERRCTCGTATATGSTPSTRLPTRTTCGEFRKRGSDGVATFTSIFPGCYSGRWPHIHFEVFPSLAAATDDANKIATSQIALPEDACTAVYAVGGYEQSVSNLQQTSLQTDMVFGDDGGAQQLGTISGDVSGGYVVELAVRVAGV